MGFPRALVPVIVAAAIAAPAGATPPSTPEPSPRRQEEIRQKVDGLFAGLVEELDRDEARRHHEARRRGERLGALERGMRLLGLAAGHLQRDGREPAIRILAEVEGLFAGVDADRSHFAGELVAAEAANARRAAALAREAIEAGNGSRGLAALRLAGRYAARARDVAAASTLPLFQD
jgi:hypothetical protein